MQDPATPEYYDAGGTHLGVEPPTSSRPSIRVLARSEAVAVRVDLSASGADFLGRLLMSTAADAVARVGGGGGAAYVLTGSRRPEVPCQGPRRSLVAAAGNHRIPHQQGLFSPAGRWEMLAVADFPGAKWFSIPLALWALVMLLVIAGVVFLAELGNTP